MRIAYFDCFSGAAGDMIAAAMLDAGLDFEFLKSQLATLAIAKLEIRTTETKRAGLRAMSFIPVIPDEHHHRNLEDVKKIIVNSGITDKAKQTAIAIFERLAKAEGKVHGKDPKDVHFHEVGALDSIVDIVSAAVGLDALRIDKVYCSTLAVGGGHIKAAHGLLPAPGPATLELLKGVPAVGGPIDKELLTPTGAAILTTISDGYCLLPEMKIEATGYGAGTLDSEEFPNVVRLIIGESSDESSAAADSVCLLETNIDDVTQEVIGAAMDKLLEAGTLDVFTSPIAMKHNRPAVKLSVICDVNDIRKFEQIIFEEGLTFGIRKQMLRRSKLAREFVNVSTKFGDIKIKVGKWCNEVVNAKPELSDCLRAAQEHKIPVKQVIEAALQAYRKNNDKKI